MPRPASADSLLRNLKPERPPNVMPVATGVILPNHSGDHSVGSVRSTPEEATDIPNKEYVDTVRVSAQTDATSITPVVTSGVLFTQVNTQAGGTLTINAPTGTPTNGQPLVLRIKTTNAQTYSWNATYRDGTPSLPTTLAAATTDYVAFMYNSTDSKWDLVGVSSGVS